MCSNESSGQFLERVETIRHQITPIITGQHDEMTFTRFRRKLHDNVVNQVCPNGEFQIIQDQLVNLDIQRMIRVLNQKETLPNHVNFESQFFQKLVKNKKRLEVVNNVLYRNFFDGTGKIKCKQIVTRPKPFEKSFNPCTMTLYKVTLVVTKCSMNCVKGTTHQTSLNWYCNTSRTARTASAQKQSEKLQSHHHFNKYTTPETDQKTY